MMITGIRTRSLQLMYNGESDERAIGLFVRSETAQQ